VTARASDQTPQSAAPGVDTADAGSAGNRLFNRMSPEALQKTVLVRPPATPAANEIPKAE
jgi:hypothetical protein